MNYLAHAFLAGNNEPLLIGNFIADGIRGNQYLHLPEGIIKGILMHRDIDSFTDSHPINEEIRKFFHPTAGKYAGVVLDVFYDHLLAINWRKYSILELQKFVENTYTSVENHQNLLPEKTAFMFPYMREYNWLFNYALESGIMRSLGGLSRRIPSHPALVEAGLEAFRQKEKIEEAFHVFFPALIRHCEAYTQSN